MDEFNRFCGVVNARLQDYTGRTLADAPVWMSAALREWHAQGWAAADVAERLAGYRWPGRVVINRFSMDRRMRNGRQQQV